MLTLLSQPNGASIEELMQATDWQQHSVRGFLAGTVKRELRLFAGILEAQRGRPHPRHFNGLRREIHRVANKALG